MSILMMLALGGKAPIQTFTQVFTANGTWPCPAGVSIADIEGYGARGQNATQSQSYIYEVGTIYATRKSDGQRVVAGTTGRKLVVYADQSYYCGPVFNTPSDPVYSSNQTCYGYEGFFTAPGEPASTGASARGLGKTMPGSTGNTAQTTTTFTDVPVTAGTNYSIVVPTGGRVTITWKK